MLSATSTGQRITYFDAKGQLRYTSFGEGNYDKQEQVIQQLLKEARS
jgi:hypothetical protein